MLQTYTVAYYIIGTPTHVLPIYEIYTYIYYITIDGYNTVLFSILIGLAMLLPRCTVVNMFEFIPSERMTHRCHYYHEKVDVTCTFGIWHPLAAEKLLMLTANTMPDQTVFHTGFLSIPGYKSPICTSL